MEGSDTQRVPPPASSSKAFAMHDNQSKQKAKRLPRVDPASTGKQRAAMERIVKPSPLPTALSMALAKHYHEAWGREVQG
jgi:hypothetical protein